MSFIVTPRSCRWAYKDNGKCATSSTLHLLFEAEFGRRCTSKFDDPTNLNLSNESHRLTEQGVFRYLHQRGDTDGITTYLRSAHRISTVRHPASRALSSYLYFCKSQDQKVAQFARDRARICALVGFDWDSHAYTLAGFHRFLRYVEIEMENGRPYDVDNHWRPQWWNIRPDVFAPTILGRFEALPEFFVNVVTALGADPGTASRSAINVRNRVDRPANLDTETWLIDSVSRNLLLRCYMMDFDAFDYDL